MGDSIWFLLRASVYRTSMVRSQGIVFRAKTAKKCYTIFGYVLVRAALTCSASEPVYAAPNQGKSGALDS